MKQRKRMGILVSRGASQLRLRRFYRSRCSRRYMSREVGRLDTALRRRHVHVLRATSHCQGVTSFFSIPPASFQTAFFSTLAFRVRYYPSCAPCGSVLSHPST